MNSALLLFAIHAIFSLYLFGDGAEGRCAFSIYYVD